MSTRIGPCAFPVLYICFYYCTASIASIRQTATKFLHITEHLFDICTPSSVMRGCQIKFYSVHSLYVFIRSDYWSTHLRCTDSPVSGCWWTGHIAYWWATLMSGGDEKRSRLAINGYWQLPEIFFYLISSKLVDDKGCGFLVIRWQNSEIGLSCMPNDFHVYPEVGMNIPPHSKCAVSRISPLWTFDIATHDDIALPSVVQRDDQQSGALALKGILQ